MITEFYNAKFITKQQHTFELNNNEFTNNGIRFTNK